MIDIGAIDCRLLGKEGSRPVPLFFPVAGRARGALHWGHGGASRRALREQCGLTPHLAGAPRPPNVPLASGAMARYDYWEKE